MVGAVSLSILTALHNATKVHQRQPCQQRSASVVVSCVQRAIQCRHHELVAQCFVSFHAA
jgi:hypothetical protein